ncbi:hypothetical protein C8N46_108137 [Kordia periserrulae]|uniref:Uncharacterized protein n=1 Tax=Kordia periserrulae TaxID=701523 RepID=A0A2T6BUT9_9FLAO|nr:hypothetical protein [Kordia periserrulae]PTX59824.1 hypothetical protein C8N46_108137 [Kordia periserrulae]
MKKSIFILAISFSVLLIAQDKTQTTEIKESNNISESYMLQHVGKEVNALQKDILKNREQSLENKNEIDNLFFTKIGSQGLLIGLISGLFAFFGIGFYLKSYLKQQINNNVVALEKECDDSIMQVQKIENETLLRIQNTEIVNADLRAKSRILIISETATPINDTLEQIFEKSTAGVAFNCEHIRIDSLSFEQAKIAVLNLKNEETKENKGLHISDFDMVILDNCDAENRQWIDHRNNKDGFRKEILIFTNEFLKLKIGFLYFSSDQRFPSNEQEFRNLKNRFLLDYVNSHAHVYANAMNVLKLKNFHKENEEMKDEKESSSDS